MTKEHFQKEGDLKKEAGVEEKAFPELIWKGRKQDSDYEQKCIKYGKIVDELYKCIEFDKRYFSIVFDFFSNKAEPYTSAESKLRERYIALLKINHKRFGFTSDECNYRLTLFNKLLDLEPNEFVAFRGFFLEEFLKRKLESKIGAFERVFSEEEIEIKNYSKKTKFSTNSDVDVIHISCTEPLSEGEHQKVGKLKYFNAYECKSTIKSFITRDVYIRRPRRKHINKIIYMAELTNVVSDIYSESEKRLNIVGYKSLNDVSVKKVEKAILRISFRDHYEKTFLDALFDIRRFYNSGLLRLAGKQELQSLLYA